MAREDPQLKLRLTEEMKARIASEAEKNGRSVNAEITDRLEFSFRHTPFLIDASRREREYLEGEKMRLEDDLGEAKKRIEDLEESLVKDRISLRELIRAKEDAAKVREQNEILTEVLDRLTTIENKIQKPK